MGKIHYIEVDGVQRGLIGKRKGVQVKFGGWIYVLRKKNIKSKKLGKTFNIYYCHKKACNCSLREDIANGIFYHITENGIMRTHQHDGGQSDSYYRSFTEGKKRLKKYSPYRELYEYQPQLFYDLLQSQFVPRLRVADLCSFRRVSKTFNNIISGMKLNRMYRLEIPRRNKLRYLQPRQKKVFGDSHLSLNFRGYDLMGEQAEGKFSKFLHYDRMVVPFLKKIKSDPHVLEIDYLSLRFMRPSDLEALSKCYRIKYLRIWDMKKPVFNQQHESKDRSKKLVRFLRNANFDNLEVHNFRLTTPNTTVFRNFLEFINPRNLNLLGLRFHVNTSVSDFLSHSEREIGEFLSKVKCQSLSFTIFRNYTYGRSIHEYESCQSLLDSIARNPNIRNVGFNLDLDFVNRRAGVQIPIISEDVFVSLLGMKKVDLPPSLESGLENHELNQNPNNQIQQVYSYVMCSKTNPEERSLIGFSPSLFRAISKKDSLTRVHLYKHDFYPRFFEELESLIQERNDRFINNNNNRDNTSFFHFSLHLVCSETKIRHKVEGYKNAIMSLKKKLEECVHVSFEFSISVQHLPWIRHCKFHYQLFAKEKLESFKRIRDSIRPDFFF